MEFAFSSYRGYLGYIPEKPTIAQKRIVTILQKRFNYARFGLPMSRGQFIMKCVAEGNFPSVVCESDKPEYYMIHVSKQRQAKAKNSGGLEGWLSEQNKILEENPHGTRTAITKTEYDFALWLISMKFDSLENVKSKISEEIQAEKEKTAQLEAEERLTREKQKQAEESKKAFKLWLQDAVFKYQDFTKLQVVKNVFLKKLNNYDPRFARETCVLIDNIDNPLCRQELIERLHTGNKASRGCFEHISGLKLPSTEGGTRELLSKVTKASFRGTVPCNFTPPDSFSECYVTSNTGWFLTCYGKSISILGRDYNLIKQNSSYMIADKEFFCPIVWGSSEEEVVSSLKEIIQRRTFAGVLSLMQQSYSVYEAKEVLVEQRLGYSLSSL